MSHRITLVCTVLLFAAIAGIGGAISIRFLAPQAPACLAVGTGVCISATTGNGLVPPAEYYDALTPIDAQAF